MRKLAYVFLFQRYLNHNRHPSFRAIVQDMENVIALTSSIMEDRRPRDVANGVLKVEPHDFFQPQPRIGNEYSFILRHIMCVLVSLTLNLLITVLCQRHDWPDKEAVGVAHPTSMTSLTLT